MKMRSKLQDPELLGLLLQGLLAVIELLSHLWTRLLGHDVLQLNIQLLFLLNGETKKKESKRQQTHRLLFFVRISRHSSSTVTRT